MVAEFVKNPSDTAKIDTKFAARFKSETASPTFKPPWIFNDPEISKALLEDGIYDQFICQAIFSARLQTNQDESLKLLTRGLFALRPDLIGLMAFRDLLDDPPPGIAFTSQTSKAKSHTEVLVKTFLAKYPPEKLQLSEQLPILFKLFEDTETLSRICNSKNPTRTLIGTALSLGKFEELFREALDGFNLDEVYTYLKTKKISGQKESTGPISIPVASAQELQEMGKLVSAEVTAVHVEPNHHSISKRLATADTLHKVTLQNLDLLPMKKKYRQRRVHIPGKKYAPRKIYYI